MAYNKEELFENAIILIEENELWWIRDVVAFLPCSLDTFYRLFPLDSDEYDAITKKLEKNRTKDLIQVRKNLKEKAQAAGLIGLYKILGSSDERKRLSLTYVETKDKSSEEPEQALDLSKLPTDMLEQLEEYINNTEDENTK